MQVKGQHVNSKQKGQPVDSNPGLCRCDHCTALLGSIHRLKSLYLIYLCQIQIKISLQKMYQIVCVGGLLQLWVRRYHMFQKVKSE